MKCFFYVLFLLIIGYTGNAQSLAINTTGATANASSILDISSSSKGVLIPRMTKAQKNAIATPASGLLIYQGAPDSIGFYYYSGSQWIWLNSFGGNDWKLTGNAGTDTAINFIGTTDNMPLVFKVNNERSGRIESDAATANTFLGNRSGIINTTGDNNTAFGFRALSNNTIGYSNVAIGSRALEALTGSKAYNVAIGDNALQNSNGVYNIGIGWQTLKQTTGNANIAIGTLALENNTTGLTNTGIGYYALKANTTGRSNVSVSNLSLYNNLSGSYNIVIGDSAAYSSTNISHVVAIGSKALFANTSGTNLTALGDSALYSNTTGYKNIALGNSALVKNTTGFQNLAIGYSNLQSNITGFANIAIGDSALTENTTNWNIAIGRTALAETTTGDKNIAIGDAALRSNKTGTNNTAIGYASQVFGGINNRNNTSVGFRTAYIMNGYSNTIFGGDAMGKPGALPGYTVNNTVAVGDSVLFNIATGASNNTAVGSKTLYSNTTGRSNIALGVRALYDNTTGNNNVAIGDSAAYNSNVSNIVAVGSKALFANTTGLNNVAVGSSALQQNTTASNNIAVGRSALSANVDGVGNIAMGFLSLSTNISGDNNVAIGDHAGLLSFGSGNVFLGASAGFGASGSNQLYIDNSSTSSPLIFGDFATNLLRVNGTLNINSQYSFPTIDGSANQVLYTNGAGAMGWANAVGSANNGLTMTGSNVALGGNLVSNTTINQGNFNLNYNLNGTGDFKVYNVLGDALFVKSTGFVGFNTNNPQFRLHVINLLDGDAPYGRGIMIENTNATATGEASIAFKNTGPNGIPANRAWMAGLNNFTNFTVAYGDTLKATNVKLKIDTLGNVSIGNQGSAAESRLDVKGSFGNGIEVITANYTATNDDHTIIIAASVGGAALTITLPASLASNRREYTIVNRNASIKTISSYNDFNGTSTDIPGNGSITLQSNGANWFRTR